MSDTNSVYRDFSRELGLPHETVAVIGKGGLKLDDYGVNFLLTNVIRIKPELLVIELGTNDLADVISDDLHQFVTDRLNRLDAIIKDLCSRFTLVKVILVQVTKRRRFRGGDTSGVLHYFQHDRSVLRALHDDLTNDSIHFTSQRALELYHFSLRRAVTTGLAMCRAQHQSS